MKLAHSGVTCVEAFGRGDDRPYKLWLADLYECIDCHTEVVTGFAANCYAEHYQPDFEEKLAKVPDSRKFWDKSCGGRS
jgi:hypothetical protein